MFAVDFCSECQGDVADDYLLDRAELLMVCGWLNAFMLKYYSCTAAFGAIAGFVLVFIRLLNVQVDGFILLL